MIQECTLQQALSCAKNNTIEQVALILKKAQERHLFVVEEHKALGIISAIDISEKVVAEGKNPATTQAHEIMNAPLQTADIQQETEFALKIMMEHNTFSCPVTQEGKLIGTISYAEAFAHISKKLGGKQ